VPAKYRIGVKQEPPQRQVLVTVTDSIGQGARTPDPVRNAWTARLASSGRWPGAVMNRGYVGAHLADYCSSKASCVTYAANLDRDFPNAVAYYFALGTNDFGVPTKCVQPGAFAENFLSLLQQLHALNPRAALYLQTPLHRADEGHPNRCGDTLPEFRDAELRMAPTMPWLTLIDGFAQPFPQNTPSGTGYVDGVHLTAQGQEQVFNAVVRSLHLGS
jgi:lysophospholipase L1-like esterase